MRNGLLGFVHMGPLILISDVSLLQFVCFYLIFFTIGVVVNGNCLSLNVSCSDKLVDVISILI